MAELVSSFVSCTEERDTNLDADQLLSFLVVIFLIAYPVLSKSLCLSLFCYIKKNVSTLIVMIIVKVHKKLVHNDPNRSNQSSSCQLLAKPSKH
jgi:hypothetical protein